MRKTKKVLRSLLTFVMVTALMMTLVPAVALAAGPVTGITVTGAGGATTVATGQTLQMEADVQPADADDTTVTWSVTDDGVLASIDPATGVLTGIAAGAVTVTATASDASGVSNSTSITVAAPIVVSAITVNGLGGADEVDEGGTLQMEAVITPTGATDQTVTWSVTDDGVLASIDPATGLLTGIAAGTVLVTATANDGSGVTGDTSITVKEVVPTYYNAADVTAVQQMIADHNLEALLSVDASDPATWSFATWSSGTDWRVLGLSLDNLGLTGTLDISGLSELESLSCEDNDLTDVTFGTVTTLKDINIQLNDIASLASAARRCWIRSKLLKTR